MRARSAGLQHRMRADNTGDHAAAVDVAGEQHRHVGGGSKTHVGDVAGAQVDLGGAAGAFDQDDVAIARKARKAVEHRGQQSGLPGAAKSRARRVPTRFPCTITCAPVSVSGLSSTGFMWTLGASRAARACTAWARPISPPSTATAALFDMFCGLNGATLRPRRTSDRASPATSVDLPTFEPVPWIITAATRSVIRTRSPAAPSRRRGTPTAFLRLPGEALAHDVQRDEIGEAQQEPRLPR